jgi:hypothetical protein
METLTWAFVDDNGIVIHIAEGNITTMEFNPPLYNISYSQMVRCYEERGLCELGMKWNWEINKFE